MYAHDAKKHLNAIRALNQDAQIDAYINQMSAHLRAYSQVGDSGNRMLDIIFSKYTAECENRHIELHWNFRAANLAYVEDFDLVTILGNLLDNAVEAAGSSQKREIFVRTTQKNDYDNTAEITIGIMIKRKNSFVRPRCLHSRRHKKKPPKEGFFSICTGILSLCKLLL